MLGSHPTSLHFCMDTLHKSCQLSKICSSQSHKKHGKLMGQVSMRWLTVIMGMYPIVKIKTWLLES